MRVENTLKYSISGLIGTLALILSACGPQQAEVSSAETPKTDTAVRNLAADDITQPAYDPDIEGATGYWNSASDSTVTLKDPTLARFGYIRPGFGPETEGFLNFRRIGDGKVYKQVRSTAYPWARDVLVLDTPIPASWKMVAFCDFDGNGSNDIFWRNQDTGDAVSWLVATGGQLIAGKSYGALPVNPGNVSWEVLGCGHFGGGIGASVIWRNRSSNDVVLWAFNSDGSLDTTSGRTKLLPYKVPQDWVMADIRDVTGDGLDDLLWANGPSAILALWRMADGTVRGGSSEPIPGGPSAAPWGRSAQFTSTPASSYPNSHSIVPSGINVITTYSPSVYVRTVYGTAASISGNAYTDFVNRSRPNF
jgi:hypothetical protein